MMKWGMEILSPQSYLPVSNWLLEENNNGNNNNHSNNKSTRWTQEENKRFENALAQYDKDTPDRWQKIALMIPGKTVNDVMKQYKELEDDVGYIEAGLVPIPGYTTSSFTLDWVNSRSFDGSNGGKRSSSTRPGDQERKKGVPWTEDEHRLFLLGLKQYGKGDWRNISRNFVVSRTPTQVASHAQKYFIRQLSGGKDKRRSSIHDITTVNLADNRPPSPDSTTSTIDQSTMLTQQPNQNSAPKALFDWNQPHDMVFNPAHGSLYVPPTYGINSFGMKMQGHNLNRNSLHGSHMGAHNAMFQMQSSQCHPHG
ncbi:transcription factor DIVARICATA-like [Papaver somniferum]|uniref:transcription factor DIVARICATA-like n=1 Tax=Papaver somniferum TaxID=3469 RepID=UPI000E6F7A91|nr:transcription factor DIVARICATA-like [Papaver somniferum]